MPRLARQADRLEPPVFGFVVTLTVPMDLANEIVAAGLDLEAAEAHLLRWAEARVAQRAEVA
jgi:hypothetical protein